MRIPRGAVCSLGRCVAISVQIRRALLQRHFNFKTLLYRCCVRHRLYVFFDQMVSHVRRGKLIDDDGIRAHLQPAIWSCPVQIHLSYQLRNFSPIGAA